MLVQIASLVVDFVGGFFVLMFLLRFYFQWLRVPFRNHLGDFIVATTNWMVKPARRVVPSLLGLDLASFLCAWLLQAALLALLLALGGRDLGSAPGVAAGTVAAIALVDRLPKRSPCLSPSASGTSSCPGRKSLTSLTTCRSMSRTFPPICKLSGGSR